MITDRLISWLMSVLFPTFGAPRKAIFKDFWASRCTDVSSSDCGTNSRESLAETLILFEKHRRKYRALARIAYLSIVNSISCSRDRSDFEESRGKRTRQVDLQNYIPFFLFISKILHYNFYRLHVKKFLPFDHRYSVSFAVPRLRI